MNIVAKAVRTQADVIRLRLEQAGLSQRAAARELSIGEREMRRYCSGDLAIPAYVFHSLRHLAQKALNMEVIGMLHSGKMSTSDGPYTEQRFREINANLDKAIEILRKSAESSLDDIPDYQRDDY
jgi:hypothetical protein